MGRSAVLHTHTEPVRRYAVVHEIADAVLNDGPAVVALVEEQQRLFHAGLERNHLVMHGTIQYEQDYDPVRGLTRSVVWALTYRDPAWLQEIWAQAQQAYDEDQAWFAEQRRT